MIDLARTLCEDPERHLRAARPAPPPPPEPPYLQAVVPEGVKLAPEADGIRLFIQPPPKPERLFGFTRAQIDEMRLYLIGELATGEN